MKSARQRTSRKTTKAADNGPGPLPAPPEHQRIAEHAYHLWQARGGDALSNWLEAERIVNDAALSGGRQSAARSGPQRTAVSRPPTAGSPFPKGRTGTPVAFLGERGLRSGGG